MAKKKKKKQRPNIKKHMKRLAKRKQKQRLARRHSALRTPSLRQAAQWPLHEVWITKDWREQDPPELVQILVARRGPEPLYGIAAILVDLACLGVKSAFGRIVDELEYQELRSHFAERQEMAPADINLAAKIIREGVAYARELGFKPDPDLAQAMILLRDADPDACEEEIPLGGPEGKPFFIAGPNDNVERIMTKLRKKLGPDGFNYMAPIAPPSEFLDEEDLEGLQFIEIEEFDGEDEDLPAPQTKLLTLEEIEAILAGREKAG